MKKWMIPLSVWVMALLLADWLLIARAVEDYQEKIEILSVMAQSQEQGKDSFVTAGELFKGVENQTGESIQEKFKVNGYLGEQTDQYYRKLKKNVCEIVWISLAGLGIFLCVLAWLSRQWRRQRHEELEEFSQVLEQFTSRKYEIKPAERLKDRETGMERIWVQLGELSRQLQFHEERLAREKEDTKSLVTDISHQLKTPVAGLKTCFEILSQENLSQEEEEEFLRQCAKQLTGLENLIGALLNISRLETGMIQIQRQPADILETLVAAANRVYLKAEEKQISIEFQETEDLKPLVLCHDVKWICEAFINILENAIKYSPSGTKIQICMIRRVTFVRIEFEDQGIGIPKEQYHKIFKRFYRGEAREVRQSEGSGVGLYLTREILERHGGYITVASRCGGKKTGSTFVVQLPYEV